MRKILILILFISPVLVNAQDKRKAARLFENGNFEAALDEYDLLYQKKSTEPLYNYRLGVCYLNTNINKAKAIPYLEFVTGLTQYEPNALYLLGRAYMFNYEFDKAVIAFTRFIELKSGSAENIKDAGKQIEYCQNAKELMKFPVRVSFENLGSVINTADAEYFPFAPTDERFLIFNSRRNDGSETKANGSFYSTIYISVAENGKFTKAKALDNINTPNQDETVVGLSNSGEVAVFYSEGQEGISDLSFLLKKDGVFSVTQPIDRMVNSKYTEIAASINADSNAIYFASNMPGGFGGIDLYVSKRLPNGKWATPQNLGPSVNTIYDEDFPSISPDGQTLFFSSKGHTGMGGYDIFKAEFIEEKNRFMQVRNIGYPINTPGDDMNFRVAENGTYGYLSALRPEGFGDLDIYRVKFEDAEQRYSVIKGIIESNDTTSKAEGVFITVTDLATGELYGEYQPNANTMRFVIILPPGKYSLFTEAEGYESSTMEIEVLDLDAFRFEMMQNIPLIRTK